MWAIVSLAFLAPLCLTYAVFKTYVSRIEAERRRARQFADLHLATIEALARAIDAKDETAQTHIRRVQVYAAGLARAIGLSEAEILGIETAALLHDVGKLAVPEHILSKAGPLTEDEFQKVQIHTQIGAQIIATVPFPYPVAPLILGHHERWDGKGYPQGLKGDEIPIGARILAVVDYFDAVTTDRPYHRALGHKSGVALLGHEAGKALEPALVARFIELLPGLVAEAAADERKATAEHAVEGASARELAAVAPASNGAPQSALENIALAHREIYALYEIAQSMGTSLGVADTMALISSKLLNIVPWSACALFLHEPESDTLRCRFATGVDAPTLVNRTMKSGEGLSGWVAQHRRTLVNGHPRASFDAAGVTTATSLQSAIVCPLYSNEKFIGSLALYHVDAVRYTDDHRRLLERVAQQAGAVIHNAVVFEQIQEDSLTDPLTGLPNRRSMLTQLVHEIARAERLGREVALIVMDFDELKAINDTYGHHTGDRALRKMAKALQGALRPYDLCVRYAGDEFIIVLSDCPRGAAETKCRELQELVGGTVLEVRPGTFIKLGASGGVAVFPHNGATWEALLAFADQEMYRDKAERRRRSVASPERGSGDLPAGDDLDEARVITGDLSLGAGG